MHDPKTVAFDIRLPFSKTDKNEFGITLFTIWHVDPETDGTDDSCGWFIRGRHADKGKMEHVIKEFSFEWDYWYKDGERVASAISTLLSMYSHSAWRHFDRDKKKVDKFLRKNLYSIIRSAECPIDPIRTTWKDRKEDGIRYFSSIVYASLLRMERKWWQAPKWHFWHWEIQVHPVQQFKRWAFSRCAGCGNRFAWGYSPTSKTWHSTGPLWFKSEKDIYHQECLSIIMVNKEKENE